MNRPATIRDVARQAGVSTATVSRVLSGVQAARPATAERVLEVARELDYRPSGIARSLKQQTTRTLGLIITDIANPFFPELVRSIEDAAREADYAVLLCNSAEDADREAAYLDLLVDRRVDGIIVASGRLSERHARWLGRARTPVVLVNCAAPGVRLPAILSDNVLGARLATDYLLDLGHRRIGHLTAPPANTAAAERLTGVRTALDGRGLSGAALPLVAGDGHVKGGEEALRELLALAPDLTAVVCYNDLTAIGAMRGASGLGRGVPADLSVIGFDDVDLAALVEPPLTTVVQDTPAMGRWAVEQLARRIADSGAPAEVVLLPPTLRVRASTGPVIAPD